MMTTEGRGLSRRSLLMSLPLVAGAGVVAGCTPDAPPTPSGTDDVHQPDRSPGPPSQESLAPGEYQYLTEEEVRVLEAVLARLVPGDDNDPGAVQMGAVRYIDGKLADGSPYVEPTYTHGPFAESYESDPAEASPDSVAVQEDQLYRYGYQGQRPPREVYRLGLAALDRYAQTRFGRFFADLPDARQDEILAVLDDHAQRGEANSSVAGWTGGAGNPTDTPDDVLDRAGDVFGEVDPGTFFTIVRSDTIEGMFADPAYGGNLDMAGWHLVGWPAAQRSYSPQEMLHGTTKQPQAMHGLPVMNPDRPDGGRDALERHGHLGGGG